MASINPVDGMATGLIPKVDKKAKAKEDFNKAKKKLYLASIFCILFMAGEIVGGLLAHSLAILTDAAHLLSDVAGFMISIFALWIASRDATADHSWGFHRAEVLGALLSILLIWGLTGVLIYEAVQRILVPEDVDGKIMFIVALCGIAVNLVMGKILHSAGHSHGGGGGGHGEKDVEAGGGHGHEGGGGHGHGGETENINVRAAFLHVVGDFVQSIGVLIASIVIWVKPEWSIADPICTFLFSILVLFTTVRILKDSIHVLMEGTPDGISTPAIRAELSAIPGVTACHDIHIWSVSVGKVAASVHITTTGDSWECLLAAEKIFEKHNIDHPTIQVEPAGRRGDDCSSAIH